MEALSNSLAAADIATTMHPYTNLRQHEKAGPLIISRGDGIRVYDERGKEYIEGSPGSGRWPSAFGKTVGRRCLSADAEAALLPHLLLQGA